jgi:hypothetical protein
MIRLHLVRDGLPGSQHDLEFDVREWDWWITRDCQGVYKMVYLGGDSDFLYEDTLELAINWSFPHLIPPADVSVNYGSNRID